MAIDLNNLQLLTKRDVFLLKALVDNTNLKQVTKDHILLPHNFKCSLNKIKKFGYVTTSKNGREYFISLTEKGKNVLKVL